MSKTRLRSRGLVILNRDILNLNLKNNLHNLFHNLRNNFQDIIEDSFFFL